MSEVSPEIQPPSGFLPQISPELPPPARLLKDLVRPPEDDPNELLRHRFLCQGGGFLLVGPTGAGKSSLAIQMMMLWALGQPAFGIQPARSLKSLLIQAENDDGDLVEMRDGVALGLGLEPEAKARATENVIVVTEDSRRGGTLVSETVQPKLQEYRPDLLWLDPALAYIEGDASSQLDVGYFLRGLLTPLLREFGCACALLHHVNKPPRVGQPGRIATPSAYDGSGSIEWSNWARAILVIRNLGAPGEFELHATKRGPRLRWKAADGQTLVTTKHIVHGSIGGPIFWREPSPDEAAEIKTTKAKPALTEERVFAHLPQEGLVPKDVVRDRLRAEGFGINPINQLLKSMVDQGKLKPGREKRSGTNPRPLIGRPLGVESETLTPSPRHLHGDLNGENSRAA